MRRMVLIALLVPGLFITLSTTSTGPAYADRCQPEELLGYNGIIPEDKHPACKLIIDNVYPALCTDYATLARCTASLDVLGTGDTFNECRDMNYGFYCVGTGGASRGGQPLLEQQGDVADTTEANKVCVQKPLYPGLYICAGGRTLVEDNVQR